jgi:hypothetical protein
MIPYLASRMIRRDSVWATHGLPGEVFMWKMALGRGRTRSWLFDSHHKRWSLVLPSWLTCVVLSCYFSLARWLLIRIFTTSSGMGEACSLSSNVEHEMIWLLYWELLDDVDYFVVIAGCYIMYCMSYIACLAYVANLFTVNQHNMSNNPT